MAKTKPQPNKNSNGQTKLPAANPTGGPSAAPPPPGGAPSLVPPGGPQGMDQVAAQQQAMQAQRQLGAFAPQPPGAMGARSDARTQINLKDLPPMGQMQAEEQAGLNPAAPLQMMQGNLQTSMQEPGAPMGPPQTGPVPPSLIGPMMPAGIENFPHDMGALMDVMRRGYAPGANDQEHAMAQNAHSMVRMAEQHAQNQASQQAAQGAVMQQLGGLIQQLGMNGQLPPPDQLAAHVASLGGPPGAPQVASSLPGRKRNAASS